MTTIIRGLRLDAPSAQPGLIGAFGSLPVATAGALDMSASVRDAATSGIDLDALDAANTLCEIELDDGMHLWLRPDELADDRLFERHAQRDGTIVLRPAYRAAAGDPHAARPGPIRGAHPAGVQGRSGENLRHAGA